MLKEMVINPRRRWVRVGGLTALAGAAMVALPFLREIDMMRGGGALIVVGAVLGLTGLICALVFRRDAAKLDALAAGRGLLASWKLPPDVWDRYSEKEFAEESAVKKMLATVVTGFAAVIGGVFWAADPEPGVWVAAILAAVCALVWILALAVPRLRRRALRTSGAEALVGFDGVYLNGEFHCWTSFGSKLVGVALRDGDPPALVFDYMILQRTGPICHTVRVPVPAGERPTAAAVVAALTAPRA